MTDLSLELSVEERKYLADLLEAELNQTRVEEHRTRTPSYREHIVQQVEIIEGLLQKLSAADRQLPQSALRPQ